MRLLGLVGSPRKGGNTDIVVDRILAGANDSGHLTEKVYLYELSISPCIDCRGCKKGSLQCLVNDDMKMLYPKLEEADVIVFGTPLYWYGPTGKMKLLIDRLRPYIASKKLKEKRAILVVPSEEGASVCNHLVATFELSFKYLEIGLINKILFTAYDKVDVNNQPYTLDYAFELGRTLQ